MPNNYRGRHGHNPKTPHRRYSPLHNRSFSHRNYEISEAQTSVDEHRDRTHYDRPRQDTRRDSFRNSRERNNNLKSKDYSRDSRRKSNTLSRSFDHSHDSNHSNYSLSGSIVIDHRKDMRRNISFNQNERSRFESKETKKTSKAQIQREKEKIMESIQKLKYVSLQYRELREKFAESCGSHLKFVTDFPESTDQIGTLLLKDGLFHEMWSMVIFKNHDLPRDLRLQSYYVMFKSMIQRNLTSFEKTFNPVPEDEEPVIQNDSISSFKRDRKAYEETTRSSTRTNVMILYEQVKAEIQKAEFQENGFKNLENTVSEFRLKIQENYKPINDDPYNIEWFDAVKAMEQINAQEEQQIRQAQIEKIKKFKMREKSPFSNRFRMMHEVQSNSRRMAVEMACVFFKLSFFYNFTEIHIVKVDQVIISQNQEILVVKAYSTDFCPMIGKMKIEPKLKNLIAVYKFCNLTELKRLVDTHGQFDGIIVYPESFNIQKFLATSEELSLLKSEYLEQVKEQVKERFREQVESSLQY